MNKRKNIFLWAFLCIVLLTEQKAYAASNLVEQQFVITAQSVDQSVDSGSLTNSLDQIKLNLRREIAQNLLCSRIFLHARSSRFNLFRDEHELDDASYDSDKQSSDYKGQLQKLCMMMLLMLVSLPSGFLYSSDDRLPGITRSRSNADVDLIHQRNRMFADIKRKSPQLKPVGHRNLRPIARYQQEAPLVEQIESPSFCCAFLPHNVGVILKTLGTNTTGNVLAIGVTYCLPDVMTAAFVAGAIGCVGGCLEAHSTDHRYFSPNQHALHNNLCTGYAADQMTSSLASCFLVPVVNGAAIGAPVGYGCGLAAGLAVRSCLDSRSSAARSDRLAQIPTQEQMER